MLKTPGWASISFFALMARPIANGPHSTPGIVMQQTKVSTAHATLAMPSPIAVLALPFGLLNSPLPPYGCTP